MKVGFIGLGQIGLPIAVRLGKRIPVHVWNRTREKVSEHKDIVGRNSIPTTLEEMHDKDVVFTCLPSTTESGNMIRKLGHESTTLKTFIDLSSGRFQESREIAEDVQSHTYIDGPISGGPRGAAAGTLTSMIGAKSVHADIHKLIEIYSKKIVCCGGVGNGNAIKSVNNYLNISHLMLASDALLSLKKQGVDPGIALESINCSSGRSLQTQERIPEDVFTRRFNYGFKLNLMSKDVMNAAPILKDGHFYECMSKVLTPHSFCDKDYTYIAKFIEMHHNEKFEV